MSPQSTHLLVGRCVTVVTLLLWSCGGTTQPADAGLSPGVGGGSAAGAGGGGGVLVDAGWSAGGGAAGGGGGGAGACTGCHATTELATGAHRAHLTSGAVAGASTCEACHLVPLDATHATQPLTITFGAQAKLGGRTPTFDASTHTCASVACHDGAPTPAWTTATALGCDGCHANPPVGSSDGGVDWHVGVAAGPVSCNACHGWTVDAAGKVLLTEGSPSLEYGARHLDGVAEGHHPWTTPYPPGHVGNIDVARCNACHRQKVVRQGDPVPAGAVIVCNQCH